MKKILYKKTNPKHNKLTAHFPFIQKLNSLPVSWYRPTEVLDSEDHSPCHQKHSTTAHEPLLYHH